MADRVDVDIVAVWASIIARLRTQLGLNSSTCFWWLDDGEPPPPSTASIFLTLAPDGGTFDGGMSDGGGIQQVTVSTGVAITVHSTLRLDTGMRDDLFLTQARQGLGDMLTAVIAALAGFDPAAFGPSNNQQALRAEMFPTGFSKPARFKNDNIGSVTLLFDVSFDWNTATTTTTPAP